MEEIVVIIICLFLNAFFAAYEMAFVSVPKPSLRKMAKKGDKNAERLLKLRESPERTLSIIQVGITLVGAISSAVGGAGAVETIQPYFMSHFGVGENAAEFIAILAVVLPITFLSVVVGELVPKTLALKNPLAITLWGARFLYFGDKVLAPFVSVLETSTRYILKFRVFKRAATPEQPPSSLEIDSLSQTHQQAVLNLAHIESRQVKDVMVPWENVLTVRTTDSMEDIVPIVFSSGHTRLPVSDGEAAIGLLHTKEFLTLRETGSSDWKSIMRPILVVQPQDAIISTLRLLQKNRYHMAVVVGANVQTLGIVTLEDISEEVWGEIYDEDDDRRMSRVFSERFKSRIRKT